MNPLPQAERATQLVAEHGSLGAVILCAAIITIGLLAAVAILWRTLEAERRRREDVEQAHYQWAIGIVEKLREDERRFTDSLGALTQAMLSRPAPCENDNDTKGRGAA